MVQWGKGRGPRLLLLAFWITTGPLTVAAGQQEPDVFRYEESTYHVRCYPLESRFSEARPRPAEFGVGIPGQGRRGYVAMWEIVDAGLFLAKLVRTAPDSPVRSNQRGEAIPASSVFGEGVEFPVPASWFTGRIRLPLGTEKVTAYSGSLRFVQETERWTVLTVEKGRVTRVSAEEDTRTVY